LNSFQSLKSLSLFLNCLTKEYSFVLPPHADSRMSRKKKLYFFSPPHLWLHQLLHPQVSCCEDSNNMRCLENYLQPKSINTVVQVVLLQLTLFFNSHEIFIVNAAPLCKWDRPSAKVSQYLYLNKLLGPT
jgi:hypothetical protein